jgi:hypothetical protein
MLLEMIMGMLALDHRCKSASEALTAYRSDEGGGPPAVFAAGGKILKNRIPRQRGRFSNIMFAVIAMTSSTWACGSCACTGLMCWENTGDLQERPVFDRIHLILFGIFCFTGILSTLWFLGGRLTRCWPPWLLIASAGWPTRGRIKITLYPRSSFCDHHRMYYRISMERSNISRHSEHHHGPAVGDWLTGLIALSWFCAAVLIRMPSPLSINSPPKGRRETAEVPGSEARNSSFRRENLPVLLSFQNLR